MTPHDVRDYDFAVSPLLSSVAGRNIIVGSWKSGVVIAWDQKTPWRTTSS